MPNILHVKRLENVNTKSKNSELVLGVISGQIMG